MTSYHLTPLQRRLVRDLLLEPEQRAGKLREGVNAAGWNPKMTARGITRSLNVLREDGLVEVEMRDGETDWRYSLTNRGREVAVALAAPAAAA